MRESLPRYLRIVGGAAVLAITLYLVDPEAVLDRLVDLRLRWVLVGLLLSVPMQLLLALRWMMIARRIGAPLRFLQAVQDYYLASFVNQALPTGLAGAALRAMRHSRLLRPGGQAIGMASAATAVILDRISGLAALCCFGLLGALVLGADYPMAGLVGGISVLAMLILGCLAFALAGRHAAIGKTFVVDAATALWTGRARYEQGVLSALVVLLLSASFYCAGRSAGVELSLPRTLFVAPLVLGAMAIPLAIAGWGLREAAAAALFASLGMKAADGVAVSVAFGAITLLASAPGLAVWLTPQPGARTPGGDTAPDRL